MSRFSAKLMEHFEMPQNQGPMLEPTLVGVAGLPGQGPFLVLYLKIEDGQIVDVSFQASGCGVTIACGSALTELLLHSSIEKSRALQPSDIVLALDGIPADKEDRAGFALSALWQALKQTTNAETDSHVAT